MRFLDRWVRFAKTPERSDFFGQFRTISDIFHLATSLATRFPDQHEKRGASTASKWCWVRSAKIYFDLTKTDEY